MENYDLENLIADYFSLRSSPSYDEIIEFMPTKYNKNRISWYDFATIFPSAHIETYANYAVYDLIGKEKQNEYIKIINNEQINMKNEAMRYDRDYDIDPLRYMRSMPKEKADIMIENAKKAINLMDLTYTFSINSFDTILNGIPRILSEFDTELDFNADVLDNLIALDDLAEENGIEEVWVFISGISASDIDLEFIYSTMEDNGIESVAIFFPYGGRIILSSADKDSIRLLNINTLLSASKSVVNLEIVFLANHILMGG